MKSKKEVKNKVGLHLNSGFCKESQCKYVHSDEDCYIHLQGQTGRDKDRRGQTRTSRDKHGQTGTDRDK